MQPPTDPPASAERWVPFAEAQQILGLSETTLRRMIRQGKVTAEVLPRAEGDSRVVYRVLVHDPPASAAIRHDSESDHPPNIRPDIATGLLERLAAQDDTIAAKDAEIARIHAETADLRERVGRAETRADLLAAELERARGRRWWKWW
jgi:hypothetical protein